MKRRAFIRSGVLFIPATFGIVRARAQALFDQPSFVAGLTNPVSAAITYDYEWNFEETGAPSSWTGTGSPEWDYTGVVLQGAQSLRLDNEWAYRNNLTAFSEACFYLKFRMENLPGSDTIVFRFRDAGVVQNLWYTKIKTTGAVEFGSVGAYLATTDTMSANTTYHIWGYWKKGTTTDGLYNGGFSTDGVRPTSGNKYVSATNGQGTANATIIYCMSDIASFPCIFDRILIRLGSTPVPDNP